MPTITGSNKQVNITGPTLPTSSGQEDFRCSCCAITVALCQSRFGNDRVSADRRLVVVTGVSATQITLDFSRVCVFVTKTASCVPVSLTVSVRQCSNSSRSTPSTFCFTCRGTLHTGQVDFYNRYKTHAWCLGEMSRTKSCLCTGGQLGQTGNSCMTDSSLIQTQTLTFSRVTSPPHKRLKVSN